VDCGGFPLRIVGIDDPFLKRADIDAAFAGVSGDETTIVLAHSLVVYKELVERGVSLVLSGHAHGGQVRLPLLGALVTRSSIPREFALGFTRLGKTTLFASPGLGTGSRLAIRFLCPPEATLLHVTFRPR
jgi:hypothetical protein